MKRFTFFVEGLNREIEIDTDSDEKDARAKLWNDLTNDEQDAVVLIDCIDQVVIAKED